MNAPRAAYADAGAAMRAAIDAALEADDLTLGEARVLLALLREIGTYSRTSDRVARARLAEVADVSERTVTTALRRLDERGAVNYSPSRGRGNLSTIALPDVEKTGSPGLRVFDDEPAVKREAQDRKTGSPGLRATEETSEENPTPRARETHRQPPLVAGVKGEGRDPGGSRAPLEDVSAPPPAAPDRLPVVDEALEALVDREEAAERGAIGNRRAWRRAVRARLEPEHRPRLEAVAEEHRPATGTDLLALVDTLEHRRRRLEAARAHGANLAEILDEPDALETAGQYADDEERAAFLEAVLGRQEVRTA